ncbi:phenylalanine--tRNA ligase beta subunit-related protein [Oligoflexia bacterium]|nr:phenylalanine--tRNA ligase beta subunit-related protein [Oligoflexia bacterium]
MQFQISPPVLASFPGLNIGVVVARDIDNRGECPELGALLTGMANGIKDTLTVESLAENPKLLSWRAAYKAFKAKPKKYKCSVENLYRMILSGVELRSINKVVDIYNLISLKYMIPAGGDDLNCIAGDICLRHATGEEVFLPLNSTETAHPKEGEVVYADATDILCRRWNWRECDKSKMRDDTSSVALVVEGLPPFTEDEMTAITEELAELVEKFCGGSTVTYIVNGAQPAVDI